MSKHEGLYLKFNDLRQIDYACMSIALHTNRWYKVIDKMEDGYIIAIDAQQTFIVYDNELSYVTLKYYKNKPKNKGEDIMFENQFIEGEYVKFKDLTAFTRTRGFGLKEDSWYPVASKGEDYRTVTISNGNIFVLLDSELDYVELKTFKSKVNTYKKEKFEDWTPYTKEEATGSEKKLVVVNLNAKQLIQQQEMKMIDTYIDKALEQRNRVEFLKLLDIKNQMITQNASN